MGSEIIQNELYVTVLPMMRMSDSPQPIEEYLTLLPDRDFASYFFLDELAGTIDVLKKQLQSMIGGHVTGYEIEQELTERGRYIIKVIQNVS
jgi:hypothetical protein